MAGNWLKLQGTTRVPLFGRGACPGAPISALSVMLTDDEPSATWRLTILAETPEGLSPMGSVVTVPVSAHGQQTRLVALANCPGAVNWHVDAFYTGPSSVAGNKPSKLSLAASDSCGSLGVEPVPPYSEEAFSEAGGGGSSASAQVTTRATRLLEIAVLNPSGAGGYLLLFDSAAGAAPGAYPSRVPLAVAGGANTYRAFTKASLFSQGLFWALSPLTSIPALGGPPLINGFVDCQFVLLGGG